MQCAKVVIFSCLLAYLWRGAALAATEDEPSKSAGQWPGKTHARLLQRGDAAYAAKKLWKAVGFYREALRSNDKSFEALWRLARAFVGLAAVAPDKARKASTSKKAYEYGLRAIQSRPRRVEGHYWAALGVGDFGSTLGYFAAWRKGIRDKFLKHLAAARRADPRYEGGGPDRLYGLYYHRLPWPMKDVTKALSHLRRAVTLAPNHILTLYFLGEISADAKQHGEAKKALIRCLAQDPKRGDRLYTETYHALCKRLLRQLGG